MEYDFLALTENYYHFSIKSLFLSNYQPFFINKKPYIRNIDYWEKDICNVLFIIGNSGSGKSFYSRKFQTEDTVVVEFDDVLNWFIIRDKILKKWSVEEYNIIFPFVKKLEEINYEYIDVNIKVDAYENIIKPFIEYLLNNNFNKKIILEGVWVAYYEAKIIKDYPLILLRTSFINSWIRRSKREQEGIFECICQKWHENIGWKNVIELFMKKIDSMC